MLEEQIKEIAYNKQNPFMARLSERRNLTKKGSQKDTRHFVIDITGSGMSYSCGDSLGVYPVNDKRVVDDLLQALGFSGLEEVTLPKTTQPISLKEALWHRLSIAQPTKNFLKWLRDRLLQAQEKAVIDDLLSEERALDCQEYLGNREFIDLATQFQSAQFTAQEYVEQLRNLQPRLYSIASSPVVYPEEIHLTVAIVSYKTNDRDRKGVASTYLGDRAILADEPIPVFLAPSHFKMPQDLAVDMIMVGPGTGVAPFRAFMQEYAARGGSGRTWLFFGEQRREFDYLYGEEWEEYHQKRVLTRLDLAFSRDQDYKVYVQHKMEEQAPELWEWISSGAYLYICGDAKRMAKDVELSLLNVIGQQGDMDADLAKSYLKEMKKQKRYQKDVY